MTQHFTLRSSAKRSEIRYPCKVRSENAPGSFINNSKKMEIAQICVNLRVVKCGVGIREMTTSNKMTVESQKHYMK
jgi:hypothetical protein